ncbi:conserved Plasmodium protein, unknown function [Plasmodium berghei]|uniref:Uncharacterized protein n=1 Tax=Plasmodium berghei TaxID=5821 RepID=A0A1D3SC37_PLABE|nr:conserved Plasmodium protein, unknown function [Plasmodium berghei]
MTKINEIEFIEETEYFKFQHGPCFCMLNEENKRKNKTENLKLEEDSICNIFIISNVKQKGLYIFNENINIFSLSDFLYKIDNVNENINIKSIPFLEKPKLIENNKTDDLCFIYTDKQNIYIFDYATDEVKLYCKTDISIKSIKHIEKYSFLVLSETEEVFILTEQIMYKCNQFNERINNIDEKDNVFLFSCKDTEKFILKDEDKCITYNLDNISKNIDIVYEECNIISTKFLQIDVKKKIYILFVVVLYKDDNDVTTVTYDIHIENYEIKKVNYSINDFFFENYDKLCFIKSVYITEWKILISISSKSCEVVIYTNNNQFVETDIKNNDLKILCIKEGYKINTRGSNTCFLSLFIYSKYIDKIYRKSKLGNVPCLKNPVVFFLLQENKKIVIEYLDQYKLEYANDDIHQNNNNQLFENEMKEVSLFMPLNNEVIEIYKPTILNLFKFFNIKQVLAEKDNTTISKEINQVKKKKESIFEIFKGSGKKGGKTFQGNDIIDKNIIDNKIIDNKIIDNKIIDNKIIDNKIIDNKIIDNKIIDNKIIDNKIIDNKIIDNKIIDNKIIDNKIIDNDIKKTELAMMKSSVTFNEEKNKNNNSPLQKIIQTQKEIKKNSIIKSKEQNAEMNTNKTLYENNNFVVKKILNKYNKFLNIGMYLYDDILYKENIYIIEKKKIPKMSRRKKECYYNKKEKKIVLLNGYDYENKLNIFDNNFNNISENKIGDKENEKFKKQINNTQEEKEKSEFYDYFHCENFDFYKTEKMSDKYCEKIVKKIEKKQKFLFDIKNMFIIQKEDDNIYYEENKNGENKNDENKNDEIKICISKNEMVKCYKDLDSYFSKNKLLKVNTEIFDILNKTDNRNMLEIILYNIFLQGNLKNCEKLIYFILNNSYSASFSNSFFLLEIFIYNLLHPYINKKENKSNNKQNCNSHKNSQISNKVEKKVKYKIDKENDKNEIIVKDSDYSTDNNNNNDDIICKKNRNEYVSKVIPLFTNIIDEEYELNLFQLMNYSIDFLNNRICNFFSHKLLPIVLENNLNKIHIDLDLINHYIYNVILSKKKNFHNST